MQLRKDVAIYIPGRALGYGMAYCVHTICIETGFKLHFAQTSKKKHANIYFGGNWIVPISVKTIKNKLVQSSKNEYVCIWFSFFSFLFEQNRKISHFPNIFLSSAICQKCTMCECILHLETIKLSQPDPKVVCTFCRSIRRA